MHASSHANPMPIFLCGRMFDFNTSIAYNIEEKSQSCISIMALKRKCNNDLRIVLDYATGDRVRATCTRDARNKREIYTINFYSGYPNYDLPNSCICFRSPSTSCHNIRLSVPSKWPRRIDIYPSSHHGNHRTKIRM